MVLAGCSVVYVNGETVCRNWFQRSTEEHRNLHSISRYSVFQSRLDALKWEGKTMKSFKMHGARNTLKGCAMGRARQSTVLASNVPPLIWF